jgi:hypothetical protein
MVTYSLVGTYHYFQEVILPYLAKISRCIDSTINLQRSRVSGLSSASDRGRADSCLFSLHYEKVIVTVPSMLDDGAVFFFFVYL